MTKVLVIDDEYSVRTSIVDMLHASAYSYEVFQASSGLQGIQLAQEELPDVILCDIIMKPHDGFYVLEQIRRQPPLSTTPFIFLTAVNERRAWRQGMELGADDVLTKPFTPTELFGAIQARLARQAAFAADTRQKLDVVKQELIHLVTHELRAPITSMNLVMELITRQLGQLSHTELADLVDTMMTGNRRLNRLVEEMVIVTQLRAGLMTRETIEREAKRMSMWDIVTVAINMARRFVSARADQTVNSLDFDQTAWVLCSPTLLRHAFAEIIANFMVSSPNVQAIALTQQVGDDKVWVVIADDGRGIPHEQLEIALENYRRFGTGQPPEPGLGLGLPLAQQLIELHGGIFEIHSVVGHGTEAIAGLPLAKP